MWNIGLQIKSNRIFGVTWSSKNFVPYAVHDHDVDLIAGAHPKNVAR